MILEDKKEFGSWYKEFYKPLGGYEASKDWFTRVQESHQGIRAAIGGVKLTKTINTKEEQCIADEDSCKEYISKLCESFKELPKLVDTRQLLLPHILINKKKVKTGKAILHWVKEYKPNIDKKTLNDTLSQLGKRWDVAHSNDDSFDITLSTMARSFVMLGQETVDLYSCFGQGGCNDDNKYFLGQTPDTFVLLIKRGEEIIGRFWGFTQKKYKVWNLANLYNKDVNEGTILKATQLFFNNLLGINTEITVTDFGDNDSCTDGGVYFNHILWQFSKNKHPGIEKLSVVVDDPEHWVECDLCHTRDRIYNVDKIGGEQICFRCQENANWCELTHRYSFEKTISFRDKDKYGTYLYGIESEVLKLPRCDRCGEHFLGKKCKC